jgi:putative heme-binding domain-containing protein
MRFLLIVLLITTGARAADLEPWADPDLPVKKDLALWLAASRQPSALKNGQALPIWYDASGNKRDFVQPSRGAQPRVIVEGVRFDGADDCLIFRGSDHDLGDFTVVLVVAPRSNKGEFRAFLAAHADQQNDYQSGFTIDMGPDPSSEFDSLNAEGRGFTAAMNLLSDAAGPLGRVHAVAVTSQSAFEGVRAYFNGKPQGTRARGKERVAVKNLILGARRYSLFGGPQDPRGFLDGDVLEVLLYERVLSGDELNALHAYLAKKHPALAQSIEAMKAASSRGKPLVRVENPPDVQMFLPGFAARKLPLDLTNINNFRYRADGKLMALAYDGNVYLLSDTDGDGLEDKATLFFESKGKVVSPVGMALTPRKYPRGNGLFVASKGKLSLIVDTDGDDRADNEIVVATGWPGSLHQVDAVGVALDPRDQSVYFGVGCSNFAEPFLRDDKGVPHYDLKSERGTVLKVSPDFSRREIVCTGIRFSVGLAFNAAGDLFATDQEGATWLANGNPFDELLHIQPGRHYGFPPRHPTMLSNVIDEPSTFDYAPQHQSTCGLLFNEPVNGGHVFGPSSWRGDAIVCGESRGKIYRTRLAKTPSGYVASNQLIASLPYLTIDACVSPAGDLVVATHSGEPDWGSGPTGKGKLFKISYRGLSEPLPRPQPVFAWPAGPNEVRIGFDEAVDPAALAGAAAGASIDFGRYVAAGDRFEKIRPGYAAVQRQLRQPRHDLPVAGLALSRDRRTIILSTAAQRDAVGYALTLPIDKQPIDLAYDLSGVAAEWHGERGSSWSGWLPHPDLSVTRRFTSGSTDHYLLWESLESPGQLTLRTQLDLHDMLRPAVQPGSKLDYTLPPEQVTLHLHAAGAMQAKLGGQAVPESGDITVTPKSGELLPLEIVLPTDGRNVPTLEISFTTNEDARPRPIPLRRFLLPWAQLPRDDSEQDGATTRPIPQLAGGDWLRGRAIFFGNEAGCFKCHRVHGRGSDLGPDLSNLIHRDYDSVLRDIRDPSAALNPDYLASVVKMKDGRVLGGIVRNVDAAHFLVRGDAQGEKAPLATADVKKTSPSPISLMPTGLPEGLGPAKMKDLLTFLLTEPLSPAPIERRGAPPARTRAEVEAVLKSTSPAAASSPRPLRIVLVGGPKDHGPGEHDYPAWQKRWSTLLALAENVRVDQADGWPSTEQWSGADVVVFYSANPAWSADKAPQLDEFLARGGGMVLLHYAVNGRAAPDAWADRIGLAWRDGQSKFRHGPVDLTIRDTAHPIMRGLQTVHFEDESYWNLAGDASRIHVLADASEEGQPRPLLWTAQPGRGRVVVSILGHYAWTFDDPQFRVIVLRAIAWSAGDDPDRLTPLATIGARIR